MLGHMIPITETRFGDDSEVTVTIGDVARHLSVHPQLQSDLEALAEETAHLSMHIIDPTPSVFFGAHEGRGVYRVISFQGNSIIVYTKGSGHSRSLESINKEFAPYTAREGHVIYNDDDPALFPAIYGALPYNSAQREFLHALRVMVTMVDRHGLTTLGEVREKGISVPVSVARHGGIADEVSVPVVTERLYKDNVMQLAAQEFGAVSLMVPSVERLRSVRSFPRASHEEVFRPAFANSINAYLATGAIHEPDAVHTQNIYHAPHSVSPWADFTDVIFPEERVDYFAAFLARLGTVAHVDSRSGGAKFEMGAYYRQLGLSEEDFQGVVGLQVEPIGLRALEARFGAPMFPIMRKVAERIDAAVQPGWIPDGDLAGMIMNSHDYEKLDARNSKRAAGGLGRYHAMVGE